MAKVNISYDTMEKKISVDVDGAIVSDVCGIYFEPVYSMDSGEYTDKYRMCLATQKKNDNGTHEQYRVTASEDGSFEEIKAEASKFDLKQEIAKLWTK